MIDKKYLLGLGVAFFLILSFTLLSLSSSGYVEDVTSVQVVSPHHSIHREPVDQDIFLQRAKSMHERMATITEKEIEELKKTCLHKSQHEQLMDSECTVLWLRRLKTENIVGVERMWGFEDTHYGAITLKLESGMMAMFKPCTSSSEDTSKELIASYLDQLLGFGQTAPVSTRVIKTSLIRDLCDTPQKQQAFEETASLCEVEGGNFLGPMIGWWEGLVPVRTDRKYKQPVEESIAKRAFYTDNLYTTQMQSRFHAFYLLIHILRHGKDEFITKTGDLVSLDLDRSRFSSTLPIVGNKINYTWCYSCYMDEWVYDTFQAVGPSQHVDQRLGTLMKEMLSHEDLFVDLWDTRMGVALDTRVRMLLQCVDGCIDRYGRDNVLLDESTTMTPKQIVNFFVKNSEYKSKRNGQQGPDNLENYRDDDQ